jgi:hypothetical protein
MDLNLVGRSTREAAPHFSACRCWVTESHRTLERTRRHCRLLYKRNPLPRLTKHLFSINFRTFTHLVTFTTPPTSPLTRNYSLSIPDPPPRFHQPSHFHHPTQLFHPPTTLTQHHRFVRILEPSTPFEPENLPHLLWIPRSPRVLFHHRRNL